MLFLILKIQRFNEMIKNAKHVIGGETKESHQNIKIQFKGITFLVGCK